MFLYGCQLLLSFPSFILFLASRSASTAAASRLLLFCSCRRFPVCCSCGANSLNGRCNSLLTASPPLNYLRPARKTALHPPHSLRPTTCALMSSHSHNHVYRLTRKHCIKLGNSTRAGPKHNELKRVTFAVVHFVRERTGHVSQSCFVLKKKKNISRLASF